MAAKLTKPRRKRDAEPTQGEGIPSSAMALLDMASGGDRSAILAFLRVGQTRMEELADAEAMESYPLISAALDILADESTQTDAERGRTVWVESPDEAVQASLDAVVKDVLQAESKSWGHLRKLYKYGDVFGEGVFGEAGLEAVSELPVYSMRRVETQRGALVGHVQDFGGSTRWTPETFAKLQVEYARFKSQNKGADKVPRAIPFEPHQIIHWRLLGAEAVGGYGTGKLAAARWAWRRVALMDDSALIFRLDRAPERLAFYLDVGSRTDEEARAYINQFRRNYRKRRYTDSTGKPGYAYDPVSQDEDIFLAIKEGSNTRVETLTSPVWQSMDDLEYFRTLLFAALTVPRAYLGDETGVVRATLSSQDVRFARSVIRGQAAYCEGVSQACDLHALACGVDPSTLEYTVKMTAPSAIFELAQLEVRTTRAQLATMLGDFFPGPYILTRVFGLTPEEAKSLHASKQKEVQAAMGMGGGEAPGPMPAPESRQRLDRALSERSDLRAQIANQSRVLKELASLVKQSQHQRVANRVPSYFQPSTR